MIPVPAEVLGRFSEVLKKRCVAESVRQDYVKWLRYFLDYGDRHPLPATRSEQVRLFIQKLQATKSPLDFWVFLDYHVSP
jgi:hypothetical protein